MDIFIATLFIIICLLLIIVVLLQKGRGGGLGAAFGGLGSSAFGTRVGDVFTWVTIVLTVAFLLLGVIASLQFRPDRDSLVVATPVFDPMPANAVTAPGDEYVKVSIKCATLRASIHYTTDGSEPTEASQQHDGNAPVDVPLKPEGTTLRARGYRSGYTDSEILSATYKPTPLPDAPGTSTTAPATGTPPPPASAPAGGGS